MTGSKLRWWYFVVAGLCIAALALMEYRDISQMEAKGGTIYLNKFVALIYDIAGKNGVLAFGLAISVFIILAGLWIGTLERRAAKRGY